jgi:hypothetical protein
LYAYFDHSQNVLSHCGRKSPDYEKSTFLWRHRTKIPTLIQFLDDIMAVHLDYKKGLHIHLRLQRLSIAPVLTIATSHCGGFTRVILASLTRRTDDTQQQP